jgi:hypothetical protein
VTHDTIILTVDMELPVSAMYRNGTRVFQIEDDAESIFVTWRKLDLKPVVYHMHEYQFTEVCDSDRRFPQMINEIDITKCTDNTEYYIKLFENS